jgi:hypothetical protein
MYLSIGLPLATASHRNIALVQVRPAQQWHTRHDCLTVRVTSD